MVEYPARALRQLRRREAEVLATVDVPADLLRLPLHRVHVEVVGERMRERVGAADPVLTGVARPVHGAVHDVRLAADVLHHVDLAARGPAAAVDVGAEQQEGGPYALAAGDLKARLEAAVRLREDAAREHPRGGVATAAVPAA